MRSFYSADSYPATISSASALVLHITLTVYVVHKDVVCNMNEVVVYVVNSLTLEEIGPTEQKRAHTQTKVYKLAYINKNEAPACRQARVITVSCRNSLHLIF